MWGGNARQHDSASHMSRMPLTGSLKSKMASSQRTKSPQLTHFLCLPLVTPTSRPQLSASLMDFKADVIRSRDLGGFGLSPEAVRPVGSLHLTLGVMSFHKDEELDKAVEVLKALKPREILAGIKKPVLPGSSNTIVPLEQGARPEIALSLKGLNSMQAPEKSTVLYAPPSDPDGSLQHLAERIKAQFKDAEVLVPENRPLLLHATIVNMSHVKRDKRKGKKWERLFIQDAQAILDRYENRVWTDAVPLEKVAICRMGAKPVLENGVVVDAEYEVVAELDF